MSFNSEKVDCQTGGRCAWAGVTEIECVAKEDLKKIKTHRDNVLQTYGQPNGMRADSIGAC
jgi:hypothetical protein